MRTVGVRATDLPSTASPPKPRTVLHRVTRAVTFSRAAHLTRILAVTSSRIYFDTVYSLKICILVKSPISDESKKTSESKSLKYGSVLFLKRQKAVEPHRERSSAGHGRQPVGYTLSRYVTSSL